MNETGSGQAGSIHHEGGRGRNTEPENAITGTDDELSTTGYFIIKRSIDIIGSLTLLLLCAPVLLLVALTIIATSPGPILFKRQMYGKGGRTFTFYKFRTMVVDAHEKIKGDGRLAEQYNRLGKIPDDPRVTPIGKFLRKFSLDELPQLLHVLRGEMSFIGPRALGDVELQWYGIYADRILSVTPGLAGLPQVLGRSKLPMQRRIAADLYYLRHRSTSLDLYILFRTVYVVITAQGAW